MENIVNRIETYGLKLIEMNPEKERVIIRTPDGQTIRWCYGDWNSRKHGEDFINKLVLKKILPEREKFSVAHHKNWNRMWATSTIGACKLGIEYVYTCSIIPVVIIQEKSEILYDYDNRVINVKEGCILSVPDSRQFFELTNEQCKNLFENGECYYMDGPSTCTDHLMILPRFVKLKDVELSEIENIFI